MQQDILHDIIRQKAGGMGLKHYYLKPFKLNVRNENYMHELHNVILVLNTRAIPDNYKVTIISTDNVFQTNSEDYAQLNDFRFQIFTDYLKIITDYSGSEPGEFHPYSLEFVQLIPIKEE